MSRRAHPLGWLPAFIVGVCTAAAAEIAVGLLLYAGPGLMRSLTTVLGVEAAAFGVGLWTAPGPRPDLVESLRKRWLLSLVAFLAATLFSAFWSVVQAVGGTALGQGLGLAFMAGLPLYSAGGVLGAMTSAAESDPDARTTAVGAAAFVGAAVGFAGTGISLPQVLTPASLLMVCLVLLSAGGLIYGSVLDARLRVLVRARRGIGLADVRVEDRHLLSRDRAARFLMEGDVVRRWVTLGEDSSVPWDVAAFKAFAPGTEDPWDILLMGGGASPLPRMAVREHPTVRVSVSERSAAVLELGREHLETGMSAALDGRLRLGVGNLDDLTEGPGGPYRLILLDTAAFGAVGGLSGLSGRARDSLCARLSPDGVMVLGPRLPEPGTWTFPPGWSVATYRRRLPGDLEGLGGQLGADEELMLGRPMDGAEWPGQIDGFIRDAEATA